MKNNRQDSGRFWDRRSKIYDAQVIPEYKSAYKKTVKRSAHFLNKEDRVPGDRLRHRKCNHTPCRLRQRDHSYRYLQGDDGQGKEKGGKGRKDQYSAL